ncbi:MAG: NHLP bacteriocin export ABC transporter permease/ATPase subunit [Lachnospiraceae bacterium]|nr:NHLP bacteriocin export ABC transporter permease/ATPase subunit [Lachnospiraceae bacterium]
MGWFEEQIRQRKEADAAAFNDSFLNIAQAVMGRRMSEALNDDRQLTTDAIGKILNFYRIKPKEVPESIRDMNEVLEYLMRPYGIMRRSVYLDKGWYKDAVGAMLGTKKEDGSVVALIPRGLSGYCFYDTKAEKYIRINSGNEDIIEREAYAFYKPYPLKKMNIADFMLYLKEQISLSDISVLIAATAGATLVGMLLPRLNAILFSDVLSSGSLSMLTGMAVFMICVTLSSALINIFKGFASARISTKLDVTVEAASMMRVLSLPADFFRDHSAGELSSRVSYLSSLSNLLINMVLSAGLTGIFSLSYISQVFIYAPAMVAPALIITLLTVLLSVVTMFMQMKISKQLMEAMTGENSLTHALINGIQKIRLSGSEKRAFSIWADVYSQGAKLQYNPPLFLIISPVINTGISLIGMMVLYSVAIKSGVTVAQYYAFNTAYGMVSGAFVTLSSIVSSVATIKPTLEMVKPLLEAVPEIDENKTIVTKLQGGIEINNVTFKYNDDMPPVLDDFSLKIHPGQYVAIVGKTGCGKSTLMRILLGFERPQKGAVYYDGQDIKTLDLRSLRRRIGTVLQDGKLFMGDIFSNIVICAPWLRLDDAWEAAKIAGIKEDIEQMPMGMNTVISEGSGGISGGQRQRLMIARAVAPKPKILMFDEATSALDNLTQKQVSDALDSMKCTRIVIAHRLSTIRHCDRIVVLDKGHIIEDGTYDELIASKGYFADLVARQQVEDAG